MLVLPRWSRIGIGVLAAVACAIAVIHPTVFFVDDAWFYLVIGRNIALGNGSTFDGEVVTNGYHPLWQGLVAGIGALTGGDRAAMLRGVLALQLGLVAVGLVTAVRALRRDGVAWPGLVVVAVTWALLTDRGWGSEGHLNLALHGVALLAWRAWWERPTGRVALGVGALLGLLVLARLDLIFLAGAVVLATLGDPRRRRSVLPLLLGLAVPVGGYVAANLAVFGHAVPVSGQLKSSFPWPDPRDPVGKLGIQGLVLAALACVNLVDGSRRRRPVQAALGLGALGAAAYTWLFTGPRWSTDVVYYYVTGVVGAGAAVASLLELYLRALPSLTPRGRDLLVGALALVATVGGVGRAARSAVGPETATDRLVAAIDEGLPPDARLYTVDAPGRLAWFTGRTTVAMDGLTQDYGFPDRLRAVGPQGWVAGRSLTHLVSMRAAYDAPWGLVSPLGEGIRVEVRAPDTRALVGALVSEEPPRILVEGDDGEAVGVWDLSDVRYER